MKILLTGAAGFLGGACLTELRARGHAVLSTDRTGLVDHAGDLADAAFCAALPDADLVVHAAAVQYVSKDLPLIRRLAYFRHNNVDATARLCARYSGRPTRFVNVGTSMMYAQDGSAVYRTSSAMGGQGVYSRSKLAAPVHVDALPNPKATVTPPVASSEGDISTLQRMGTSLLWFDMRISRLDTGSPLH